MHIPSSPMRVVSLSCASRSVSMTDTRLPLSPYRNPISAPKRQSRCFPRQLSPVSILFCKPSFKKILPRSQGHEIGHLALFSRTVHARQATLHTAFTANAVSTALQVQAGIVQRSLTTKGVRRCTISGLHRNRVRILHAIEGRPVSAGENRLPPASTPDWA